MTETLSLKVEIDPESQKDIKELCEKMKEASRDFPRHPINQDNSRFIALVSRIETLEAELVKLRNEVHYDIRSIIRELDDL